VNEYTATNGVRVQMHKDGSMYFGGPNDALGADSVEALREFFGVRPEPKPAWHDAKPGDIWLLSFHGFEDTEATPWGVRTGMSVNDAEFVYPPNGNTQPLTSPRIVAARRIFPEDDS
jgi:hypothetical protein